MEQQRLPIERPQHRIISSDRREFPLNTAQAAELDQAMTEGRTFFRYDKDTLFNIPKDIVRVEKIIYGEADNLGTPQIPAGGTPVSENSKGYQAYVAAKKKLVEKMAVKNKEANRRYREQARALHNSGLYKHMRQQKPEDKP